MDDIKLERNCVVQPLELPLLIRKDGSVLASMKLSVSTKQLDKDKNPEILVNLNPANEFMSTVENETAKTNMKKRTKRSIFNARLHPTTNSKNDIIDDNNKVYRVSWELAQKDPCVLSCEADRSENPSSTNLKDSTTKKTETPKLSVSLKEKETLNERIEENPEVKNSREKTPVSKEREPFQEKLVSSENRETQVLPVANTKRKDTKNTKPALYFEIHNESIICTEKPKGVLGDADKASWINFYYDDEMEDMRNKLPQIKKDFDSTVLWKIDTRTSSMPDEETHIEWNLRRQLEIALIDEDVKIGR